MTNTKRQKSNENTPNYLFFDTKFRICMNSKEAREAWHVSKSEFKVLQSFIHGNKQRNYKLRVYWKINCGMRFLLVNGQLPTLIKNSKMQSIKHLGNYIHKTSDYNFAGRVLRSSFDPSLPIRSLIFSKSEKKILPGINQDNEFSITKKFLVRFSDQCNDISEVPTITNIESTVENIIKFLNMNIQQPSAEDLVKLPEKQLKENTISEIILDFLLDDSESWCFLKCKKYRTSLKAPKFSEFYYSKTLKSFSPNANKSDVFEMASINARLKTLEVRLKEFLIKQKSFMSPRSIKISKKELHSDYSELNLPNHRSLSPFYTEHLNLYSQQINKVAAHYDEIRYQAKKNKMETVRRMSLIDYGQRIDIIITIALEKMKAYPELVSSMENCKNFFHGFLGKVFDGDKTLDFFVKFQAIYEWSVNLKQFKVISGIFSEEVKASGIFSNKDYLLFSRYLQKYEGITFKSGLHL